MKLNEEMGDSEVLDYHNAYTDEQLLVAELSRVLVNFRNTKKHGDIFGAAILEARKFVKGLSRGN